jgi:Na+-driven multidrug efflux pump
MIGWGQGFQPICAMNWGAGQYGRVKKALFISAAFGTIFLIIAAIVLALTAQKVSGLFSKDSDVSALAAVILRLQCISLPVMGIYALCSMFMQNTGHYFSALLISIARQGIFYIPLLFTLLPLFTLAGHSAQTGLFCVQPAADIISFLFGLIIVSKTIRKTFHKQIGK